MSGRRTALLIALGAILLTASYPPFHLPFLSFIALTPAVFLLRVLTARGDSRSAFRLGFWYGAAANGLVLHWLVVALWHFTPLALLGYLLTTAGLGAFGGALFWLVVRIRGRLPMAPLWLVLPVLWTAMEWSFGHLGDISFPWLGLGTSLVDAPVLVQWADIAGAHGVTWWVVWCNVVLAEGALAWPVERRAAWRRLGAFALTLAAVCGYGLWRTRTLALRDVGLIGLVQPNEGFREKWDPAHADSVVATLLDLSQRLRAQAHPDLIAWPEAALPGFLIQEPAWDSSVTQFVRQTHTPVITGALHVDFLPQGYATYNAAFLFDSTGTWRDWPIYEKRYLVPVVEHVPFVPVSWFRHVPWLSRWSGGFKRGTTLPVYRVAIGRFGVLVCYESAFADLSRRYRAAGADFLVNVTNDAWYGRTAGPYQHAAHVVMRAIETRMGIARAANDGISMFVDPLGRITGATGLETQTVEAGRLQTSDVRPLYVTLGDWAGTTSALLTLVALIFVLARKRS
ncbi:MAG TPA: apolipoprotein N-acyltransferase [Gemmatimonadales bacterium]